MRSLLKTIDELINRITMYKLLLWGLRILFAISWLFSAAGILPFGLIRPIVSISILIGICFTANYIFAKLYNVDANSESTNITALLLYFIFQPPRDVTDGIALGLAGVVAIASKYIVVKNQRHIFNPAAFGAFVLGLTGLISSRWWIGRDTMFIFVFALGVLLVRKIHRARMVGAFLVTATLLALFRSHFGLATSIRDISLSYPILFFGCFMLTEPFTTPPRKYQQISYGILVGFLFSTGWHVGSFGMTPELSLLIGNLAVFYLAGRKLQPLKLIETKAIGDKIFEYRFKPEVPLEREAGQYLELTLPLKKTDFRGNRRTFTIASSPSEKDILFGIKQVEPVSAFKKALAELPKGTVVTGNNLAGDFILPPDLRTKIVFIAGGIGITPFRAMLKYLIDKRFKRNITLFYAVSDPKQIVYKEILDEAKDKVSLKVIYVLNTPAGKDMPKSWNGETGYINKEMIAKNVLDYEDRVFYISGPDAMVQANKQLLLSMGIARKNIKTDYFAGY